MKNFMSITILAALVFNLSCSGPTEKPKETVETPEPVQAEPAMSSEQSKKVLEHHLSSFGANNLDEVMADYSDESVLITPDSAYVGKEQIAALFAGLFEAFPTDGTTFELDKIEIRNELVYIVWHAKTPSIEVPLGTDTFIIKEEKIVQQTFAGVINPVE